MTDSFWCKLREMSLNMSVNADALLRPCDLRAPSASR